MMGQFFFDPDLRSGIFEFVESGNGLLLVHPATWYNWTDWPEYNRNLVGGCSRCHPPFGDFEVRVTNPDHPVMASVPKRFTIKDELYRFERDEEGSDIHIMAVGIEDETGKEYPVARTVDYGDGRVVNITLGHDGDAHQHDAYISMLQNSIEWLSDR